MDQSLPLVGRDGERERFVALLHRAAPGRPTVLILDGPPEIGCGRLLRELAVAGRRLGAAVATSPERIVVVRDREALRPGTADPHFPERLAASAPVLVVTARQPVLARTPAEVHRVVLTPLGRADVRRLIAARLGGPPSDRLLDLARVAAGRPGAILDLIDGLQEERLMESLPGRLPERTRARLAHRVANLSGSARHLVQAATAVRSPVSPARLSEMLGGSVVALLPDVEEALDSGLLVPAGDALAFSHELVRAVVEASMPHAVVAALRHEQGHHRPRARVAVAPHPRATPRTADWSLLSERELEIAELVGLALTNQQIASRLGRSPHTVNYHLRQIFRKFGLASRVELVSLLRLREHPEMRADAG
ncbi:helix-turn-helix transcriptional regulator [Paractinoplanes atraurantiacus]|uniref:DNA-binding transcriptional regulator, CsgD family n=1 Tax=Paractinoplanes atraurantiacus TaxID=1036182 RepID=A0A285HYU7_9ACTN|nr:helix-turn-helix transcriptional regulator [Actinoplanes atraurantiacus]SNY40807.1 DNA-binding transcriptional regulator, CsgD family [Actinoplanes atraurantiacus]